jgi:hypothetical protein
MSKSILRPLLALPAIALCLTMFTVTAKAGIDSYEIYLNNRLLLRQVVGKSFTLQNLSLNESNANDKLVIYYSECRAEGKIGKERNITLKDGKGKIVKEWKFADANGPKTGMVIPVKELLQLAKKQGNEPLSFFYTAQGHPEAQVLASFQVGAKTTASLSFPPKAARIPAIAAAASPALLAKASSAIVANTSPAIAAKAS